MDKLVDSAVNLVEEGRLQQAVEVLQQGITLLSSTYPGRCGAETHQNLHTRLARVVLSMTWTSHTDSSSSSRSNAAWAIEGRPRQTKTGTRKTPAPAAGSASLQLSLCAAGFSILLHAPGPTRTAPAPAPADLAAAAVSCFLCCSPELSELHNQAALLLLFGHQHDAAAKHASDALDITQKAFGPTHPLTGHRLLRLGTIRCGAGVAGAGRARAHVCGRPFAVMRMPRQG